MTKIRIEVEVDLTINDLKGIVAEHFEYPLGTTVKPIDAIVALLGGTLEVESRINLSEFVPTNAVHSVGVELVENLPHEYIRDAPLNHRYAVVERYENTIVKVCLTGTHPTSLNPVARGFAKTYGATYVEA